MLILLYWIQKWIPNCHIICYLASVYADFCRPTGLESVRPMPGTYSLWNHQGYHKLSVYGKKLSTILSMEKRSDPYATHTGAVTLGCDVLTLALISIMTIDRPCRQCSRSSICQSSWSVSMNPVNNWIQSNATSKVRMGLTSWPRRHTWLGRSCSQLMSWQQLQYIWIGTNFNSKVS